MIGWSTYGLPGCGGCCGRSFNSAAILDGGWAKWIAEERSTSAAPAAYAPANFVARFQPERIATKEEVRTAIGDESIGLVNALDPEEFAGRGPVRYGRSGHIPSSANVSFLGVLNSETNAYLPLEDVRAQFASAGVLDKNRIISYCGGGIAACGDAFLLTLLGARNVAVYDGSMTEWAADPELPLEVG
jgi:thiosulfate/3-mercaptopyruvate sulfurtransferase